MAKVKVIKDNDIKEEKKKKKFKIKISWGKVFVWIALIAMIGSALLAILSPILYGNN